MGTMEEDARKTDQEVAGNPPPQNAEPVAAVPPRATPSTNVLPDSPFLGKLVTQKPATPLGGPSLETDAELQKTIAALKSASRSSKETEKTIEVPKMGNVTPEDLLHSGNVISLLTEEAQKESGVKVVKETRLAKEDTPIERNIREIGLQPRTTNPAASQAPIPERTGIRNIRTYASDMSEEIRKRGETLATIVNAEQLRTEEKAKPAVITNREERIRNLALLVGAALLVIIGIGAIAGVLAFVQQHPAAVPRVGIIPANHTVALPIEGKTSLQNILAVERNSASLNLGEIEEVIVSENSAQLSASDLLTRLGAPSVLARNATDIMVGVHAYNHNQPFILVRVSAYDRAFEGMLAWEGTLGDGLGAFFAPTKNRPPGLKFSDRVFQNLDVRESQPEWRVLYAFPERNLLLITTNESTVKEVVTRLTLQSGN